MQFNERPILCDMSDQVCTHGNPTFLDMSELFQNFNQRSLCDDLGVSRDACCRNLVKILQKCDINSFSDSPLNIRYAAFYGHIPFEMS